MSNGAMIIIDKAEGTAVIIYQSREIARYDNALAQLEMIQDTARAIK